MQHFRYSGIVAIYLLAAGVDATAQGLPAAERGTRAGASAVAEGATRLQREQESLIQGLSIQRDGENAKPKNSAIEKAVPLNVAQYFNWSKEQAAIKLSPGD